MALIERTGAGLSASIIDGGSGESILADDLVSRGHHNVTVLDISETTTLFADLVDVAKNRPLRQGP